MYFVFKDLFGNNLYDAIVNDTVEISDALYASPKRDTLHENCNGAAAGYNSLRDNGFLSSAEICKINDSIEEFPRLPFKLPNNAISDANIVAIREMMVPLDCTHPNL